MGRLIRPVETGTERGLVGFGLPPGLLEGSTIRWVDLDDCATPGRAGLRPPPTALGITIGCVVAAPACFPLVGIRPAGWGGLTAGIVGALGGF
jgi:hypothetical protein